MGKRLGLLVLTAASPLALVCFVVDLGLLPGLFAVLASLFPAALMAVGAADRGGRLGRTALPIVLLAAVLPAVMAGLFAFRGGVADGPWWGGLPAAAAFQLYGLFALPLVMSSLGYAWTFERCGLRQDDLDALRRRFPAGLDVGEERRSAGERR
ncbi:MAG: hypothetical protein AAFX50_00430 [Acidobacteriota bacterium]